ncbi:hypothetical protein AGMMS50276_06330 [Synergistales bacterium]|nr:hypothetical protein AGMMS50276_06330 [Synergistales bacterium]
MQKEPSLRKQEGTSGRRRRAKRTWLYVLLGVLGIFAIGGTIISVMDIAGDIIANLASDAVREKTGMTLSVGATRGNPVRGYTFENVSLTSGKETVLAAKSINGTIDFVSLLRASPRLSLLAIDGVDIEDLNGFISKIQKLVSADDETKDSDGGFNASSLPLNRISLRNSRFTYKDSGAAYTLDARDIEARLEGSGDDLSLHINAAAAINGLSVEGLVRLDVKQDALVINQGDLRAGKGQLKIAGTVKLTSQPLLDLRGSIRDLEISELHAILPDIGGDDYVGAMNADFSIEGQGSDLAVSSSLDFKGSRLSGYPIESLSANAKYARLRLTVDNLKASSLGIPLEGSMAVAMRTGEPVSVMVKLEGGNAPLSEIAKLYPQIGKTDGKVDRFSVNIQGPVDSLSGAVELSSSSLALLNRKIENLALQIKLSKGSNASVSGKCVIDGAQTFVQGSISSLLSGPSLDLTANLRNLDVKKISDLIPDAKKYNLAGQLAADISVKGKMSAPSVSGKLSSPKFTALNYTLIEPSLSFLWEKDSFTLKESGGTWNGIPLKASGTVGPLSSATPTINMTARLAFKSETLTESLKPIVPDIETYKLRDYKLKGTVEAGVKITGKLPSPKIDLSVSSPTLSALDSVTLKGLDVTAALPGGAAEFSAERFEVKAHAASLVAAGIGLQSPGLSVTRDGRQIRVDATAKSGEGSITGGGAVTTAQNGADTMDMAFSLNKLDLAPVAKSSGLSIAGVLTGKVALSGAALNPNISFTGSVPRLSAEGITLDSVAADISGNAKLLKINSLKASVGGAPLSATGSVNTEPFGANVDITGSGLDLAALTAGMPDLKGQALGKFDLQFNVKTNNSGASNGSGSLRSSALTLYGMKLSNIVLPLSLSPASFKSENASLTLYGGKAANTFSLDMKTMKFSDTLNVNGVDVNALAQDVSGGLGGKITGKGNLSMKLSGSVSPKLSYSGSGEFTMGEGAISDFSGLNLLTKAYGVNGIRYTRVTAPLRVDATKLTIAKGASAVPPANDPLYKSASLVEDGALTLDQAKKLYFVADLNVNLQLLNMLTGGAAGGAEALIKGGVNDIGKNLEGILRGAVNAGIEKGKDADFRSATVKITGTSEKPSFALVKIAPSAAKEETPQTKQPTPQTPQTPAQPSVQPFIPKPGESAQSPANTPEKTPSLEDKAKEEIDRAVRRGLEGIFKR